MLHTKVSKVAKIRNRYNQVPHLTEDTNGKVPRSSAFWFWRRRFLKGFYHNRVWRSSWSCNQDHLNKLSFPRTKGSQFEIWVKLSQWFQRRRCLKMWTDRRTDAGVTGILWAHSWPFGSGELINKLWDWFWRRLFRFHPLLIYWSLRLPWQPEIQYISHKPLCSLVLPDDAWHEIRSWLAYWLYRDIYFFENVNRWRRPGIEDGQRVDDESLAY